MTGSKNKINMMAYQAAIDDDVFDKLCFVNEIGTSSPRSMGKRLELIALRTPVLYISIREQLRR
jgi:hypothetical protein